MLPEALAERLSPLPASPFAGLALERLQQAGSGNPALEAHLADPVLAAFLGNALGDCPYLCDLAVRDAGRLAAILSEPPELRVDAIVAAIVAAPCEERSATMAALRRAKADLALTLGLADLGRAVPLAFVTGALSHFADAALDAAIRCALAEQRRSGTWIGGTDAGGEAAAGFAVLALGKHGAEELNYSSDIDIIALFEPQAPGLAEGVEPSTFWVRIVRTVVKLLQERTADGYVFRTDLRLRPDPGATPVALSAPAALVYYESMGQNWERAALIKARPAAGDRAAGARFLAELAPFIWRRYLDFAAIADIHSIKRQIHAHRGHGAVEVFGHDIKRGRGGIREIEFFVQTQQLIAGGRDRSLRGRETRPMLAQLAERGWIDAAVAAELDAAYVFLREVEHRLQMVRDEQTHRMPSDAGEFARIARLMGYGEAGALESRLRDVLAGVAVRYSELFENAPGLSEAGSLVFTGGEDDPETLETLRGMGFAEPAAVTASVRAWHFGRAAAMRSTAARESLTEITPALLRAFARAGNADAGFRAFDALLRALPAGAQLFALLRNKANLLDLLVTTLAAAPRLAEAFGRNPHMADALIDPASLRWSADEGELAKRLAARVAEWPTYEGGLDAARRFVAEQCFLVSAGLLNGALPAATAGLAFSAIATATVSVLFDATRREFELQHGAVAGGCCAVLALGRLGSREMTAGSDLDLIVIYDHDAEAAVSDGRRPLPATLYFARLTQRFIAAISAPTAAGAAYAVDLRLRPSGRAGPLATPVEAFRRYQREEAWSWEALAVSRGRAVAGDADLMGRVDAVLAEVVAMPRDRASLAKDVAEMRARIEREKPPFGPFDVKLARGGLVDCEFAAQFLTLCGLERRPGEPTAAILRRAAERPGEDPAATAALAAAADLQSRLLQVLRITGLRRFQPDEGTEAAKRLLAAAAGLQANEFPVLQALLAEAQDTARTALEQVLGRPIG